MDKRRASSGLEHPSGQPSSAPPMGTFSSGGVPVLRSPAALARRFFQICTTATVETLAGESLTPLQFGVLAYLNCETGEPEMDQNGLAARLGIDRASTSQLVDELEERGLVKRRVNDADRRARLLCLTPQGVKLHARLQPTSTKSQMRVFASLTSEERQLLFDLLVRVIQSNPTLARPGTARRKRGSNHSTANKSRPSLSIKT
jgi:DNA-binding MarR family transcriptional regulator